MSEEENARSAAPSSQLSRINLQQMISIRRRTSSRRDPSRSFARQQRHRVLETRLRTILKKIVPPPLLPMDLTLSSRNVNTSSATLASRRRSARHGQTLLATIPLLAPFVELNSLQLSMLSRSVRRSYNVRSSNRLISKSPRTRRRKERRKQLDCLSTAPRLG